MKFAVQQSVLLSALERVVKVATKGVREFGMDDAGRVRMKVEGSNLILKTSNGNMDAKFVVAVQDAADGSATVAADTFKNVVKNINKSDSTVLSVELRDNVLAITDTSSRKKAATIETYPDSKTKMEFVKPSKPLVSYKFPRHEFTRVIKVIGRYAGSGYIPRFGVVVLHFQGETSRFVAGDGNIFAIFDTATPGAPQDDNMWTLPAVQSIILASIADDHEVTVSYRDSRTCFVELDDGSQIVVKGIPDEKYINYFNHLNTKEKATNIVDVSRDELTNAVGLVEAVKDKEAQYQTLEMHVEEDSLLLVVAEEKHNCEYSCTATNVKLGDETEFKARYVAAFFRDVLSSPLSKEFVRFYCIDPDGTIVVEPVDLIDQKDENGVSLLKLPSDSSRLYFFFGSCKEG